MTATPLTEADIIDQIYSAYELDDTTWSETDSEYQTARRLCNAAIMRWEYLEGIRWNELFTTLTAASTGTKTVTSGVFTYACPDDMRIPPSADDYVQINSEYFLVVPLAKVQQLVNSDSKFVYFTGNLKSGFTLNINPRLTLTTGHTITYNYYKKATLFTATTSSTEIGNPMFIVHDVLSKFFRNDGQLTESQNELQIAENLLQEMKAENTDVITDDISGDTEGFGV